MCSFLILLSLLSLTFGLSSGPAQRPQPAQHAQPAWPAQPAQPAQIVEGFKSAKGELAYQHIASNWGGRTKVCMLFKAQAKVQGKMLN